MAANLPTLVASGTPTAPGNVRERHVVGQAAQTPITIYNSPTGSDQPTANPQLSRLPNVTHVSTKKPPNQPSRLAACPSACTCFALRRRIRRILMLLESSKQDRGGWGGRALPKLGFKQPRLRGGLKCNSWIGSGAINWLPPSKTNTEPKTR